MAAMSPRRQPPSSLPAIFDHAYWCPSSFACHVYDDSTSDADAMMQCNGNCPDNTTCIDFLRCYYCPSQRKCYPANATTKCLALCGGEACLQHDKDCPACERFNLPLTCSKLLPVIVVASISTALFPGALGAVCFKAHKARNDPGVVSPLSGPVDFEESTTPRAPSSENAYRVQSPPSQEARVES